MRAMERPSRVGLISLLLAVEVVIAGIALYTLRGSAFSSSGGFHHIDYAAAPIAPVAAGLAPNVTIDDIDSGVTVTASNDGLIHVTDRTEAHGFLWGGGEFPRPVVTRTLDGVRIVRAGGHSYGVAFGMSRQHVDVAVPQGTHLTILRSSGANVSGLHNDLDITSQDGRITLDDISGNIKAHSDDGRIVGTRLHSNQLNLTSNDGRIQLSDIELTGTSPSAEMHTKDGPVIVSGIFPAAGNYSLTTADGRIELSLLRGSDATVEASTGDGHVIVDGQRSAGEPVRVGTGSATMHLRTEDGTVHITTNGAK